MGLVIHGDALVELKKFDNESVQLCVTSPPYFDIGDYGGTLGRELTPHAYIENLLSICEQIHRVLKKDGKMLWVMGGFPLIPMGFILRMAEFWNIESVHIANRSNGGSYYFAVIFDKGNKIGKSLVFDFEEIINHGTKFGLMPEEITETFIETFSRPGDIVLDPFAGSGFVGEIANRHNREYTLIDIIERNIYIIEKRLDTVRANSQEEELAAG